MQSFLPAHERGDDLEQASPDSQQVEEDPEHRAVIVDRKGFCFTATNRNNFNLRPDINLRREPVQSPFLRALRRAFNADYNLRGITEFSSRVLQWRQRIGFTDHSGKRFVFNVGQYLRLRDAPQARLQQVFIVHFQDKPYAFVIADQLRVIFTDAVNKSPLTDGILDLDVFQVGRQVIRGMPAIANVDWLYFIAAPLAGPWTDLGVGEDEPEYLLSSQWNLDCQ